MPYMPIDVKELFKDLEKVNSAPVRWITVDKKIIFYQRNGWVLDDNFGDGTDIKMRLAKKGVDFWGMRFRTRKQAIEFLTGFDCFDDVNFSAFKKQSLSTYKLGDNGVRIIGEQNSWRAKLSGTPAAQRVFFKEHVWRNYKSRIEVLTEIQSKALEVNQMHLFPDLFKS